MSGCGNCCGNCGGCGELVLSQGEITLLLQLAQIPFLPVARKADSTDPVYLENPDCDLSETSLILQCLEKRGLISLDYDQPLKGWDYSAYSAFPIHGSFALTAKGQQVLDVLEMQGVSKE